MKNTHSHARRSLPGCGSHDRRIQPRDAVAARNIRARRLAQTIVICLAALLGSTSDAGLVITFEESGSNVTATLSGSFATLPTPTSTSPANLGNWTRPSSPYFDIHPGSGIVRYPNMNVYPFSAPNSFPAYGTGTTLLTADASTTTTAPIMFNGSNFFLEQAYVTGISFNGVSTWNNQSLTSMGLTPGSYSGTLLNSSETVTVNVGAQPVPEPASYVATLGVGAACWIAVRRRRRSR